MFIQLFEAGFEELAATYTDEQLAQAFVQLAMTNTQLQDSLLIVFFSLLYLGLASIVVNLIFPIQRSKSFEDGNKRVAPKGPETPAL